MVSCSKHLLSSKAMNTSIIIIAVVASQLLLNSETVNGQGNPNLINLGQVDGKYYFYDKAAGRRNWTASGNYCRKSGMELATIETASQAAYLKSKYSPSGFSGYYWTAARDAQLPREITWNTTGTVPADSIGLPVTIYGGKMEYQTCLMYYSNSSPTLDVYPCATPVSGVLCQT